MSALPACPVAALDPFLDAIREQHRIAALVETIGMAEVIEAIPAMAGSWALRARREQLPPENLGHTWLLMAGRGFGKSLALIQAVNLAVQSGTRRIHIVAPTAADIRDVIVEGPSGVMETAPPGMRPTWLESRRKITWPNGSVALTFSGEEPESLRGPEAALVAIDEWARMQNAEQVLDMALMGLRVGPHPRMLISTTPKSRPWLRQLIKTPGVSVTHGSTFANEANLPATFLAQLRDRYEGTRLGLQELQGLIVEASERALFHASWLRIGPVPEASIERVSVGVDPSGGADLVGIVAAARLADGGYAVLADRSCRGSPAYWSEQAIRAVDEFEAEDLSVEVNYGGDMASDTLRQTAIRMADQGKRPEAFLRVKSVTASRGKTVRAEPISALYEQGRVVHRPGLAELEAEMLNFHSDWDRARDGSPNRVDALVWAMSRLKSVVVDIPMA